MLKNTLGHIVEHEQSIIPLISFNKTTGRFRCIGTAFFINSAGLFVTAKHVLFDNNDKMFEMIMGIQTLSNKESVTRDISHLSIHPQADIVLGRLGNLARDGKANEVMYEPAPPFILSFNKLDINDNIMAFGYPRVEKEVVGTETTFKFTGVWSEGLVKDFCPDGSPLLKNSRCYQTSMHIESGASGGPVFKNSLVVGINSTGWHLEEDEEPLSYITPIDYICDLQFELKDSQVVTIKELVKNKFIQVQ